MMKIIKKINLKTAVSLFLLVLMLAVCVFQLVSCMEAGENNTNQDELINEPDIVKVTDDGHIIKLQPDGVTVTKTDKGSMSLVKSCKFQSFVSPTDLLIYDKYLVAIVTLGDVYTQVSFFDMEELNDGTDRLESVRDTFLFGKYFTSRIYEDSLYILSVSTTVYYAYNEVTEAYEQTGAKDSIYDSVHGTDYFNQLNEAEHGARGYLMSRLDLKNIETSKYTLSSYLSYEIQDLYFSRYGMYIILHSYKSKGCGSVVQYSLAKISLDGLQLLLKTKPRDGYIESRYQLYDNGENLFVVSGYDKTEFVVYDSESIEVFATLNTAISFSRIVSVYFDESNCYLITSFENSPTYKIDITDAKKPRVVGYSTSSATAGLMYEFSSELFVTIRKMHNGIEVSFYDASEGYLYYVNTILLDAKNTRAASNKKAAFVSFENNFFAFASEEGSHIFGIDEYGYLVESAFLPSYSAADWFFGRVKLIDGYVYAVYAGEIIAYSLLDFSVVDSISTAL